MQELKITVKRSHQKAQSSKLNGPSEKNDNFSQYIMQPNQDSIYRASNVTFTHCCSGLQKTIRSFIRTTLPVK